LKYSFSPLQNVINDFHIYIKISDDDDDDNNNGNDDDDNNNNNNKRYIEPHSHVIVILQGTSGFTRYNIPADILIRIVNAFPVSPIHVRLVENCLA
jgi:hypothetical protein